MISGVEIELAAVIVGAVIGALAARVLLVSRRFGGAIVTTDTPGHGPVLRSPRWRLTGRPDAVVRSPSGAVVPVELKRGAAPKRGPYRSHRVQLSAYCALVEEAFGAPPPYGILRYGDGRSHRIPWDAEARRELARIAEAARRPYRGAATPGPRRCAHCAWVASCDARWTG
ncbi:MAG TPA: PD-(D/E)XK nuclease family protein [Thermoplasmata archaeon]|nr:PD-(D/E)XK nuclease family protein [Thermoplasmata archaeon]